MRVSAALLTPLIASSVAAKSGGSNQNAGNCQSTTPDVYEAIHQAENNLAYTLDTKNWAKLGDWMTQDVVYDNRPLGPDYGGLSVGLQQVTENTKKAFGTANVAHHVSNAIIKLNDDATKANVTTYIVYSRWEPTALHDPKQTFRIYERCDDLFVLDQGTWKLKYSLVVPLAPKPENPYFNDA